MIIASSSLSSNVCSSDHRLFCLGIHSGAHADDSGTREETSCGAYGHEVTPFFLSSLPLLDPIFLLLHFFVAVFTLPLATLGDGDALSALAQRRQGKVERGDPCGSMRVPSRFVLPSQSCLLPSFLSADGLHAVCTAPA